MLSIFCEENSFMSLFKISLNVGSSNPEKSLTSLPLVWALTKSAASDMLQRVALRVKAECP